MEDRNEGKATVIAFGGVSTGKARLGRAHCQDSLLPRCLAPGPAVTEAEHCRLLGLGPKWSRSGSRSLGWQFTCMLPSPLLLLRIG